MAQTARTSAPPELEGPMDDSNPNPTTRVPTPSLDATEGTAALPPQPPAQPAFAGTPPPATTPSSWAAPRHRDRGDGGRIWTLVVGLFILGIGVWFFLERTLGIDLPAIHWSQFWPVILIVVGAAVLLGALRRERR
jgi:uncharacterized membrane protein